MRRAALIVVPLLAACAGHGTDPDQLEVVQVRAEAEPAPPRAWRAALKAAVEGEAPLEMWLPLPAEADDQQVHSLVVEVGPPGVYALEELQRGQRVLHVSGPPPRLTAGWRAGILQPAPPAPAGAESAATSERAALRMVRRPDGSVSLTAGEGSEGIRLSTFGEAMRATVGGAPAPFAPQPTLERAE